MSCSANYGRVPFLFLLFLFVFPSLSAAQTPDETDVRNPYTRFTPSMAIIVAVLITALFFMGILSIYIRNNSQSAVNGGSVRPVGGVGRSRRGMRGLEASVIETFPTMVYSEVKVHKIGKGALECAVCLNEFEDDETLRLIPKCDHVFHPECIDAWLTSHTTCPVCRANLAPEQPGDVDSASQPAELNNNAAELDLEAQNNGGGDSDTDEERRINNVVAPPDVEVIDANRSLNRYRGSMSSRITKLLFPRSHSTGHSLVQPGENTDRFTLRLPIEVRKQLINRKLNRATSLVTLPGERSSLRGYRTGEGGRSYRSGKSFKRLEKLDQEIKSDRWVFSITPPFVNRASSMKSPKVAVNGGEGTSSLPLGPVADSSRPPV